LEQVVLDCIKSFGKRGCISDEIGEVLYWANLNTITPRYKPLEKKGLIYRNGEKRRGKAGRSQLVMRATSTAAIYEG
jgi:hypothetical protein